MSKQKEPMVTFYCALDFQKPLTKKEDRDFAFRKFLSLVEEDKESFAVSIRTNKRRRRIILDSEEFMFTFSFRKKPSVRIVVSNPNKNLAVVNKIGSRIVSYLNTILGEVAVKPEVYSRKIILHPRQMVNLGEKLIGTGKIAKISEFVKQTLEPFSISFEYKIDDKYFLLSHSSSEKTAFQLFASRTVYKEKIPFNLLEKEITELSNPEELLKKLVEMEL